MAYDTANYTTINGVRVPMFGPAWERRQAEENRLNDQDGSTPARWDINNPFGPTKDPHGAFGSNVKDIEMPNPFADLSAIYPNLAATNATISGNIANQLAGELSDSTQAAIQDASAQFGVSSGMPGAGLQNNRTVRDLGITTEALQDQGLKNYLAAIGQISATQTVNPGLQTEINMTNALNRAAPNPTDAAAYSKTLFDQYLSQMRGPGGGTGGMNFGGGFTGSTNYFSPERPSYGFTPNTGGSSTGGAPSAPGAIANHPASNQNPFGVENWNMFSPEQQAGYGAQVDWARQFQNQYE